VAAWKTAVDNALSGKNNPREHVRVMTTPLAFNFAGAKVLPVYMDAGKLKTILDSHSGMSTELVKQIPEALADPVAIFKSATHANGLVAMLELKDKNGSTVVAALHMNVNQGRNEITINKLASVYGKDKKRVFLSRASPGSNCPGVPQRKTPLCKL
jgi:hypothetical protein